ncbi:MAG: hypothetical protein ACOCQT_00145 [Desulfovermiculus sp.]
MDRAAHKQQLATLLQEHSQLPLKLMVSNELAHDFSHTLHEIAKVEHTWILDEDEQIFVGLDEAKQELEEIYDRDFTDEEARSHATECILVYTSP